MNARERMMAAIERRPVDRIPTDIWATAEAWEKLEAEFGSREAAREALHIDGVAAIGADYIGPPLPDMPEDETVDLWGWRSKRISHSGGTYMEPYYHPLADARTIDDLDAYAWPQTDWFDYSNIMSQAQEVGRDQIVSCGYLKSWPDTGMAPFLYHNLLRGLEQSLIDPLLDPDLTHAIVNRISDFFYDHHRRMFEACPGLIDIAQVTDDLGSQRGPLISLDL